MITLLGISGALIFATAQDEEFNKIDAFTSASKRLKIDSVIVFKTKAFVYWNEYWEDDMEVLAYRLKWGTTATSFQDSLNLEPYEAKIQNVDTLQPLAENTEYVAQFYRDYNRKQYNLEFPFNTPPLPNKVIRSAAAHQLQFTGNVTGIDIYTVDGRQVFSNYFDRNTMPAAIFRSVKKPGLYIVNFTGVNGSTIRSEKVLIGG